METWKPTQTCPACGKQEYKFRGRKKIPAEPGQEEQMETKYRCTVCENVWTVRGPVSQIIPNRNRE